MGSLTGSLIGGGQSSAQVLSAIAASGMGGSLTAIIGDSLAIGNGGANFFGGNSFFVVGSALSSGKILPYIQAGVSGNTTAQMLARISADVINAETRKPAKCIVLGGTNDVGSVATATSLANLAAMYDILRGAGIEPIGATIPPRDSGNHDKIAALNAGIKVLCRQRGMHCLDFHSVLTNPTTGNYLSTYSGDGIHPLAPGVRAMAPLLSSVGGLYSSNAPFLTDDLTDTTNMIANGVFIGDTNADGVANSWTGNVVAGSTTPTIETGDTNIVGNWAVLTMASGGRYYLSQSISAAASSPAGWAVGDVIEVAGIVNTDVETGAAAPSVRVNLASGTPYSSYNPFYQLTVNVTRGVFFRRFTVPTGTTSMSIYLFSSEVAPTAAATVKYARVSMINLTRLGLV